MRNQMTTNEQYTMQLALALEDIKDKGQSKTRGSSYF